MQYKELMEGEQFTNNSPGSNKDFRERQLSKAVSPLHKKFMNASYLMVNETNGSIKSAELNAVIKGKKSDLKLQSVSGVVKDSKGVVVLTRNGSDFYWEYVII